MAKHLQASYTALNRCLCVLQLLQYHVVANLTLTTAAMTNGQILPTALSGQTLKVCIWLHGCCCWVVLLRHGASQ